jgi:hypothetical protein
MSNDQAQSVRAAVDAPWTLQMNPALSNRWNTVYTLYFCGLVRGQLVDRSAQVICDALNLANADGFDERDVSKLEA